MTDIAISVKDDKALFKLGNRIYYSAYVQMDYFWQHIIHKQIADGSVKSQEKIFRIDPQKKLLRMTYDEFEDVIYCELEDRYN